MLSLLPGTLLAQLSSSSHASAAIVSEIGITELQGSNLIFIADAKHDLKLLTPAEESIEKTVEILSFKVISNENDFSITLPQTTYHFVKKDDNSDHITGEFFVMTSLNKKNNQPISITSVFKDRKSVV